MTGAAGLDFFSSGSLPAPPVSAAEAEQIAAARFGLTARARPLGSQQDRNFLLTQGEAVLGVLKIANPAFSAAEIQAQDAAAGHLAAAVPALAPATEETWASCDRMRELGVVIQPTGDRMGVLKIKPPLCLDTDGADFFAATLDRVLTEGW